MNNYGRIKMDDNHKDIIYKITESGCYEVISHCKDTYGYTCIKMNGIRHNIHRWLYQKETGINIEGLDIRHKCDNPLCINLEHLEHGTRQDNVNDMIKRNRQYSILSKKEVLKIVDMFKKEYSRKNIAKHFNVSCSTIDDILTGITWTHITNIQYKPGKKAKKQSGIKNINWDSQTNKWRIQCKINNKTKNFGRFKDLNRAIEVREKLIKEGKIPA